MSTIENTICQLIESLKTSLEPVLGETYNWKWDPRFESPLAEFSISQKPLFYPLLLKAFEANWDFTSQNAAPKQIKKLIAFLGGMMVGQELFTTILSDSQIVYAALWPWGNQSTLSLRLGCLTVGSFWKSPEPDVTDQIKLIFKPTA